MAKATIYTVREPQGPLNAYGTKSEAMKAASNEALVLKVTTEDLPLRQLIVTILNSGEWEGETEVIQDGLPHSDGEPEDDFMDLDDGDVDDLW